MCLMPQDEILKAADLLCALLTAEQRASHFDQWFAVYMIPIIHPASHCINPIIMNDNGQSSMGSSESGYDSMPELEYPLSPLYIPQSPEAWSIEMEENLMRNPVIHIRSWCLLYNLECCYVQLYFIE